MAGQIGGVLGSFPLGSFVLGAASSGATVSVAQDFEWSVNATIRIDLQTTWSFDSLPLKWYRVLGKPFRAGSEEININTNQLGGSRMIQYMAASNLNELCRNLKEGFLVGPFQWPIESVGKFSRPVRPTAEELLEVNELIDQPFCEAPDCQALCLDIDKTTEMGIEDSVSDEFFSYEGTGGMELSGSADTAFTT